MGQFVNDVNICVTEALEGVALSSFGNLVLVRDKNVILINPQKERNQTKVAIVCGGGSGHEPAHSSFVNREMLSAAICGDVFASPSVGAIVDGIRSLVCNSKKSPIGVLVIIKNYTGDKINFGMACEILSTEGISLKKLIVADDVSLHDKNKRRGVAGTVLVYKIAGALALQQQNSNSDMQQQNNNNFNVPQHLSEVYEIAEKVNDNIHSMGCALSSCHKPDGSTIYTLPEGEMEIGVGIHGERGVLRTPVKSSDEIVIIGAHYDSLEGTPGANDNGSGVAALLALARAFVDKKPVRTLRFVAFTNEEPPYFLSDDMGSFVYARRCCERKENVVAMLSLETIGYYTDEEGSQNFPIGLMDFVYSTTGNFISFVGNIKSRRLL